MRVRFGPWTPDQPDLDSGGLEEATNCAPVDAGYAAISSLTDEASATISVSTGLSVRSAAMLIDGQGIGHIFAGVLGNTAHLYKVITGSGATVTNVDRTATYATGLIYPWQWTIFGNTVLAANGTDTMQVYTVGGSSQFRDQSASASAPLGLALCTVRDFVFNGRITPAGTAVQNRVQWCQINNPLRWTPSPRLQSDFQDLSGSGSVVAMTGGDFAAILTDYSTWRATYVGSPIIFRFDEVSPGVGCLAPGSVARYQNLTFFLSPSGFQLFDGQECFAIGKGKIDDYFFSNFSLTVPTNAIYNLSAVIDPFRKLYVVAFPLSAGGKRLLIYHWPTQRWTLGSVGAIDCLLGAKRLIITSGDARVIGSSNLGIAAFNSTHAYAEFRGSATTATFATGEAQVFEDTRAFVRGVRPLIQNTANTTTTVEVGKRNRLDETASYGSAVSVNANGLAPLRANARYLRTRLNISGGFERAIGFDFDAIPSGKR